MSNMQGYKNINEYSNSCIQSKLYFLKWEKRIKRHPAGMNKTEMQKNEKRKIKRIPRQTEGNFLTGHKLKLLFLRTTWKSDPPQLLQTHIICHV